MMIMKRWSKDMKTFDGPVEKDEEDSEKIISLRYGALCATSLWMSFLGSKKLPYFHHTMDESCGILKEVVWVRVR